MGAGDCGGNAAGIAQVVQYQPNIGALFHSWNDFRMDCCQDRLTTFEVRVGVVDPSTNSYDLSANKLCASFGSGVQAIFDFACTVGLPAARFVSVKLLANGQTRYLSLCEVQVRQIRAALAEVPAALASGVCSQHQGLRTC